MIEKSQQKTGREYTCGDCPTTGKFTSVECARTAGWCVSQNRQQCYCHTHAPLHRHVGPGYEQLKIENLE